MVDAACKALKDEDDFLRGQINHPAYAGQRAGILRPGFMDERYYQRLVARQLLAWKLYEVHLELARHDLVLTQQDKWITVVEMKLWMGSTGNPALPLIVDDIRKLQQAVATHRILLVFSENPKAQTPKNSDYLRNYLTQSKLLAAPLIRGQNFEIDSFLTYSDYPTVRDSDMDFWVAGIEV